MFLLETERNFPPESVLPDEENPPGLSVLAPALPSQDSHQDQVHEKLHQQKFPKHFTSRWVLSKEKNLILRYCVVSLSVPECQCWFLDSDCSLHSIWLGQVRGYSLPPTNHYQSWKLDTFTFIFRNYYQCYILTFGLLSSNYCKSTLTLSSHSLCYHHIRVHC